MLGINDEMIRLLTLYRTGFSTCRVVAQPLFSTIPHFHLEHKWSRKYPPPTHTRGLSDGSGQESACLRCGDLSLIPRLGRSPGEPKAWGGCDSPKVMQGQATRGGSSWRAPEPQMRMECSKPCPPEGETFIASCAAARGPC